MRIDTLKTASVLLTGHVTLSWLVALLVGAVVGSALAFGLGAILTVAYGGGATFSRRLALKGRPLLAFALSGLNPFLLLWVAVFASRSPAYSGVSVAFALLTAMAAIFCIGLWFISWPECDS